MLAKPVIWVGSSKDDISALPGPVKASFGHRLRQVQNGETPLDMRALAQFGTGVFELRERFDKNGYRLMYVVKLEKAIYVLHAFMKKSQVGDRDTKTRCRIDRSALEARAHTRRGGLRNG